MSWEDEIGARLSTILSVVGVSILLLLLLLLILWWWLLLPVKSTRDKYHFRLFILHYSLFAGYWEEEDLINLPPWKLLRLEVLLLLLSTGGFGFAIGYRQNSCPSNANDDNCCLFFASRIALGSINCTGSSSLLIKQINKSNLYYRTNSEMMMSNQIWVKLLIVKDDRWKFVEWIISFWTIF